MNKKIASIPSTRSLITETEAFKDAIRECLNKKCDVYFFVANNPYRSQRFFNDLIESIPLGSIREINESEKRVVFMNGAVLNLTGDTLAIKLHQYHSYRE